MMRGVLSRLTQKGLYPDHAGLAHDVWARFDRDGKIDDRWLDEVTSIRAPAGYARVIERWTDHIDTRRDRCFYMRTQGRLLVGHGNAALTEVGITLHRTWGVPVIPGSALKGLLAHYVAACYGATQDEVDDERMLYASNQVMDALLRDGTCSEPKNALYRRLFGAPELTGKDGAVHRACRGQLTVHDALWVPARGNGKDEDEPFLARDVLTVHQRGYYQSGSWPSDHENPNPVSFVSVPPDARFLFTLSCDDTELLALAAEWLMEALQEWGVGGKTAAGYGRLCTDQSKVPLPQAPDPPDIAEFRRWMDTDGKALSEKKLARAVEHEWLTRLCKLDDHARALAAAIIKKAVKTPKNHRKLLDTLGVSD